ncbi:APH(6)-I family aminoglycoside O-phosphotransferase [Rhodopseudomonas boonkerdii]|uniref:APH(6)-I family aminoglycoside O-phosphotransferase n=1 Tax=Rhodopseudomonas boonkerdii TaxID=475937 RepID=UPI001E2844C3|nr:APH(6)-I family aminoglycoside O-phosphotransferase [Rhodopseudomonas boonkerdii]UGV26148.1 APH(6)-I family aminoglycoside O-phosphotransferase [Rhodopseudomonas boonkerdii]
MTAASLPQEIDPYLRDWALVPDGPLITTRSSWVLPVLCQSEPATLKVARIPDEHAGYQLMSWWNGQGAAKTIAASNGALLLERATGPRSLAHMARSGRDDEACRILCRTAEQLHVRRSEPLPELYRLDIWFQPLFDLSPSHPVLAPAAEQARRLLADQRDIRPLHGDLHHDNVLDFGERGWLAIDPHGLVGERIFDFANIFTNPDLADPTQQVATLPGRFEARLGIVTEETGIETVRLLEWIVAWTGLSAAWFIGDGDHAGAEIDLQVYALAQQLRGR